MFDPEEVAYRVLTALRSREGGAWLRIYVDEAEVVRLRYPPSDQYVCANPNVGTPPPPQDVLPFTNIPS